MRKDCRNGSEKTACSLFRLPRPAAAPWSAGNELNERRARTMKLTCIAGLGGLPQITVPLPAKTASLWGFHLSPAANRI
ncbi:hypothetical protein PO124_21080 [Bacillus licheniformis]|nr:hypothetical protein [Bacillus licheniformis]